MAVVVIGGLITSTLLNLFIVPAIYLGLRASPAQPKASTSPSRRRPSRNRQAAQ